MAASVALKLSVAFSSFIASEGTDATCTVHMHPGGTSKAAPWGATTATKQMCPSSKPSMRLDPVGTKSVTDDTGTGVHATQAETACCSAALCGTGYTDGAVGSTGKTACPAKTKLQSNNICLTAIPHASVRDKCGNMDATALGTAGFAGYFTAEKDNCCKMPCSEKFQLKGAGDATKLDCPDGDYQVAKTAFCSKSTCTVAADQATCCQKKCAKAVVLFGGDTTVTGVEVACKSDTADLISPTAYCTKKTCTATDTQCCQQKCGDGFVLHGTTDTGTTNAGKAKLTCGEGLLINTDSKKGFCAKSQCMSTDAKLCCLTKCTAAKGFELSGGKTEGKYQCPKSLRVHPTGNCKGTDCKGSAAVCCQQKCTDGFKLKGATGTGTECAKDLTVHASAYCKGSSCATSDAGTCCQQSCSKGFKEHGATTKELNTCAKDSTLASDIKCAGSPCSGADSKLCCNEKCIDKKTGFKVKGAKTKEPNECKDKETVASKARCAGDCSSDDAKTCCLAQNITASTDAHSAGLASVVGMLLLMSTAL